MNDTNEERERWATWYAEREAEGYRKFGVEMGPQTFEKFREASRKQWDKRNGLGSQSR